MQIIEQASIGKNPQGKNEDGIVVTDDFIAVIDGSTSKSDYRHSLFSSNGRRAMLLVSKYIRRMPKNTSCDAFLRGITAYIRKHYKKSMLPRLAQHPEDRLTCSAIIYSRLCREVWMVGDCQCLIGDTYYDNPKPAESVLAAMRADEVRRLLAEGATVEQLLVNDLARPVIIPRMIETMQDQNVTYSVIDGFPISRQHVRIITLDFRPWEIVFASDGYPFLCPTLQESEERLMRQREEDPLNVGPAFQATKGFIPGNLSFDDRTYIRFSV